MPSDPTKRDRVVCALADKLHEAFTEEGWLAVDPSEFKEVAEGRLDDGAFRLAEILGRVVDRLEVAGFLVVEER